jgi:protocatechuate 3,4-dioxygenase beta subunit
MLAPLVAIATFVSAHPGDHSASEHVARSLEMRAAHLQARKCAGAIEEFEQMRRELRLAEFQQMPMELRPPLKKWQSATTTAAAPHYSTIQNSTCVTATEVTEGPYYIGNEYVRTDLRESQSGIKLVLDIGVIDTTTCKPFTGALVELWAANATGAYGGYTPGGGNVHEDTFLRGGDFTNSQGMVEITTLYPGYYTGRTAHIHAMVHKNIKQASNGTFISSTGTLTHIGQFFFEESWNDKVYATSPYTTGTHRRTLNSQDRTLEKAGASAFVSLQYLGSSLSDGLLGYITVAVDGSKSYKIHNKNTL